MHHRLGTGYQPAQGRRIGEIPAQGLRRQPLGTAFAPDQHPHPPALRRQRRDHMAPQEAGSARDGGQRGVGHSGRAASALAPAVKRPAR